MSQVSLWNCLRYFFISNPREGCLRFLEQCLKISKKLPDVLCKIKTKPGSQNPLVVQRYHHFTCGAANHCCQSLRLDNTPQGLCRATPVFFNNIWYDIDNIYAKSLNSQIEILFNDINHYMAGNTKKKFFTNILCMYISYSVFNENKWNFQYVYRRAKCRELCLRFCIYALVQILLNVFYEQIT